MLDGILVIDKPSGITSHDVINTVRKKLHTRKVGHTGTLDPLATGVLIVCVEKATKLVEYLTAERKIYEVSAKFGIKTDTGDITGSIIREDQNVIIDSNMLNNVIKNFVGKQKQIPPMYSAIKINGKKLYELAREGIEIERQARDIEIYDINNISQDKDILKFSVACSKGTYIRTLCEDIAEKLGTVATMINLKRIKNGNFDIQNAIDLDLISEEKIIPIEKLFDKEIDVTNDLKKLLNGIDIVVEKPDGLYKLYTDKFIGIGRVNRNILKREIIL